MTEAEAVQECERLRHEGTPATSEWKEAVLVNIDTNAWYLVQTNGMEWRDSDLFVMRGIAVALHLKPERVRGRPVRIARINL
jgi:hypothetical protein